MQKIIYGILILIYTLYSFFVSDGSEVRFIMLLTIVLIFSVVLEKEMQTKRLIKGRLVCIFYWLLQSRCFRGAPNFIFGDTIKFLVDENTVQLLLEKTPPKIENF
ncbi:hypothetical protein AAHB63_20645 [Bacillus thuringiensis]